MLKMPCSGALRALGRMELKTIRQCSTAVRRKQDVFFDSEVQGLLKSLTGLNLEKIFRSRRVGEPAGRSSYQFLTDEELHQLQQETKRKAEMKLQMPPVMEERNPEGRVLEKDPLLVGFDVSKYVFTDITYGVSDRERIVVVRDVDGTLRTADMEEKDRINQTYFPREGRKLTAPPLFDPAHLSTILGKDKYEYILDRNCLQFDPDHPVYIRTAELVYNHINENKHFGVLHSTRHFGPFVFYLCWSKQIDEFIIYQVLSKDLSAAAATVKLYQKINQDFSFPVVEDDRSTVLNFANSSAAVKGEKIKMALQK